MKVSFFRSPKTTAELRAIEAVETDPDLIDLGYARILVRPKRRNLPTAYDDISKATFRNWKKHREHQYRPAPSFRTM